MRCYHSYFNYYMRCYHPYFNYCWNLFDEYLSDYWRILYFAEEVLRSSILLIYCIIYYIVQYYHCIFSRVLFYTNLFLCRYILFLVVDVIHNSQFILISIFICISITYFFTFLYSIVYMSKIVLWLSHDLRIISLSIVLRTLSLWLYDDYHFHTYLHSA